MSDETGESPIVSEDDVETVVSEDEDEADLSRLYQPFDDVKEQIREVLAMDRANAALPIIQQKMQEYATIYNENFESGKAIPAMPDLTGFVAELGLELVTVPMGDFYTALETDLAKEGAEEQQYLFQMFQRISLLFDGKIFGESGGQVLLWVTAEKQELRPESLDEVREIVLKRWKEVEARALALKAAEELAEKAKASEQSLAEVFAGRSDVPVVETEPFTWMTYGEGIPPIMAAMYQLPPPRLNTVRERGVVVGNEEYDNQWIKAPGWDFMETVYSLPIGESGVVFNQPQTCVYIVRVTSSSPSDESLWDQFQMTPIRAYFPAGRQEMVSSSFEAWLEDIREKTGFRWINKPSTRATEWSDEGF